MERMYPTGCLTYNDDERSLGSLQEAEERDVWPMMLRGRWALFKRLRRGMSDLWWWEAAGLSLRGWWEGCLTYDDERPLGSLQEAKERDVWPIMMRGRWALFKRLRRGMSDLLWWEVAGLSSRGWWPPTGPRPGATSTTIIIPVIRIIMQVIRIIMQVIRIIMQVIRGL